jgi:hypothetical protein
MEIQYVPTPTDKVGREDAMTHLPNIHRHPDGSIDFDFYRRRASRQRRRTRRLVFRHFLTLVVWPSRRIWQIREGGISVRSKNRVGKKARMKCT